MGGPEQRQGRCARPGVEQAHRRSSERRLSNFVGADLAAKRLSDLDEWRRACVIKCNPDPPQIPVRLRALYDGKLLFSPVPYLAKGFPCLRIDPVRLAAKRVDFVLATDDVGGLEVRTRHRGMDRSGNRSRRLRRQHRRLPDALDQRNLRFNAAPCCRPERQRAVFDSLFPDAIVETIPTCAQQGERIRYPPILASDYLKQRLDASKPRRC
jgi:hypothetical protein